MLNESHFITKLSTLSLRMSKALRDEFLATERDDFKRFIRRHFKDIRGTITRDKIINSLTLGTVEPRWYSELNEIEKDYIDRVFEPSEGDAVSSAGVIMARRLSRLLGTAFVFNKSTQALIEWLNQWNGTTTAYFQNQRLTALNKAISVISNRGYSPVVAESLINSVINMTPRNVLPRINNYQNFLDGGDSQEIALEKTRRISNKIERNRHDIIADAELTKAYGKGNELALSQAITIGIISMATKIWVRTLFDERRNHRNSITNDGIEVPIGRTFPDGSMFPMEINEGCILNYMVRSGRRTI